jgi:NifU-like protein involved in Fe-S cluster formation
MNEYQEQLQDHFKNPRNYGKPENMEDYSESFIQNLTCGDEIKSFVKIKDKTIYDIKFVADGCSICIATASLLSEELIGKDLTYLEIFNEDQLLSLVGIPLTTSRKNCALLSLESFKKAANSI